MQDEKIKKHNICPSGGPILKVSLTSKCTRVKTMSDQMLNKSFFF